MGANKKSMHIEMALMFSAKRNDAGKRGGGDYTPAEELAIANNEGCPLMEGGISSGPGGGGSSSQRTTFMQGKYQF